MSVRYLLGMLLTCRLKMRTHLLGVRIHPLGGGLSIKRFDRNDEGSLKTPLAIWDWALREAFSNLRWRDSVDWSAIRPHPVFHADVLSIHNRSYYRDNVRRSEDYEAVDPGQIVTQHLLLTDAPENISHRRGSGTRIPTMEETTEVLKFIGSVCGVSPWGNRYGYGRFDLLSVEPVIISEPGETEKLRLDSCGPPKPGLPPEDDELDDDADLNGVGPILQDD